MTHLFYDAFTMQVPKDWIVEKSKQGASIFNYDKSTSIVIQVLAPFTQLLSEEFAGKIRSQGKGSELKDNGEELFSEIYRGVHALPAKMASVMSCRWSF